MIDPWTSGLGTTPGMWEFLSELLDGEKLPESLNQAIYALKNGDAVITRKAPPNEEIDRDH